MQTMGMRLLAVAAVMVVVAPVHADVAYLAQDDAHVQSDGSGTNSGLVAVKRDEAAGSAFHRKGYVSYDLAGLADVLDARSGRTLDWRLDMFFVDSGAGSTAGDAAWDFQVYGLTNDSLDGWDETTIDYTNAPANDPADGNTVVAADTTSVGTFSGVGKMTSQTKSVSGVALNGFIAGDANDTATFIVVRDTESFAGNSYVHAFQSKDNAGSAPGAKLRLIETDNRLQANGEFELAGGVYTNDGWGGDQHEHDGLIAGSQKAAFLDSSDSASLFDTTNVESSNTIVDLYFATTDGGGGAGDRGFNLNAEFYGNGQINLRVNGQGNVQVYNNQGLGGSTGWKTLTELAGLIEFSEDNDANLGFDDAGDVLNVHRLKLEIFGTGTANPYYNVHLSAAGSSDFTATATGLQFFQNDVPDGSVTAGLQALEFDITNGNGDYAVDSVHIAIPEPASFAMLGFGALALCRRRR